MDRKFTISMAGAIGLTVFLTFPTLTSAQPITDADSISKNAFQWTQEEREFGFAHFDEVFPAREVPNGDHVHALPPGRPISSFEKGGEKEKELEKYMTEQKVAGLLILQDGKIRLERYALRFDRAGRWTSQSVAKSVTSTLVGAAIKDGFIHSVDDPVTDYIPELKGSAYEKTKIRHLLTMSSGVRWTEVYTDGSSDIVKYYITPIEPGMEQAISYMRQLPAEAEPGKKWVYKTGETNLLGVLVTRATGQSLSEYLSAKIWAPYGMEQKAAWNIDRTDKELAGCCLQMSLRDFGRFGQFMLDSTKINGKPIVPDDWLENATHSKMPLWPGWGYGYQWWTLNDGTYRAIGIHGQMIHIDPARKLVVVVTSAWPEADSYLRQAVLTQFLILLNKEIDKDE